MTGPSPRPTREQVDAELANVARGYVGPHTARTLAAEVRAAQRQAQTLVDLLHEHPQVLDDVADAGAPLFRVLLAVRAIVDAADGRGQG